MASTKRLEKLRGEYKYEVVMVVHVFTNNKTDTKYVKSGLNSAQIDMRETYEVQAESVRDYLVAEGIM